MSEAPKNQRSQELYELKQNFDLQTQFTERKESKPEKSRIDNLNGEVAGRALTRQFSTVSEAPKNTNGQRLVVSRSKYRKFQAHQFSTVSETSKSYRKNFGSRIRKPSNSVPSETVGKELIPQFPTASEAPRISKHQRSLELGPKLETQICWTAFWTGRLRKENQPPSFRLCRKRLETRKFSNLPFSDR